MIGIKDEWLEVIFDNDYYCHKGLFGSCDPLLKLIVKSPENNCAEVLGLFYFHQLELGGMYYFH